MVAQNTKVTKKILKVLSEKEKGIVSVGGASGITSMLTRGTVLQKQQTASEQHHTI